MKHLLIAKQFFLLFILSVILFSCKEDEKEVNPPFYLPTSNSLFVLNEGQFQAVNASVTHFNEATQDVGNDVFTAVNGKPLGDIAHSMKIHNHIGYIVVNNSQKIEVVDLGDFSNIATIEGFMSPRYLLPLGDGRAYVSNLFGGKIDIVDLTSNTITGNIQLTGSWSENMLLVNGKVYVCMADTNVVAVIDPINDVVINNIEVNKGPVSLALDFNKNIWVLSDGGYLGDVFPELVRIDTEIDSILERYTFPDITTSPSKMIISMDSTRLYYLNGGVYIFSIDRNTSISVNEFIPSSDSTYFYGVGVSRDNKLYIGDAIDFVQKGKVYIYSSQTGNKLSEFNTGIAPNGFIPL